MLMSTLLRGGAALLVLAAIYAGLCAVRPFADCWSCSGRGWRRRFIGGNRVACRACRGTGERIRAGRRAFNHLQRTHARAAARREATR